MPRKEKTDSESDHSLRFKDVPIGEFFAEAYIGSCARVFQKKSRSTAYCWRVRKGSLVELWALNRTPNVAKFGGNVKVLLID
jgi:hypothetical protein